MGSDGEKKPLVFTIDGVDITPYLYDGIPTVDLTTESEDTGPPDFLNGVCIRCTFKTPKRLRCHSRKRLKKLLMSCGMPRNTADRIRCSSTQSYDFLWWYIRWSCINDF